MKAAFTIITGIILIVGFISGRIYEATKMPTPIQPTIGSLSAFADINNDGYDDIVFRDGNVAKIAFCDSSDGKKTFTIISVVARDGIDASYDFPAEIILQGNDGEYFAIPLNRQKIGPISSIVYASH